MEIEENQTPNENREETNQPEIIVNDYGAARDDAVVIEEADRTVLLTEDETIIIEKNPAVDVVPKNRPRRIYGGMWGPVEIATVALGLLTVLTVILLFVFLVIPAQKELEANRAKRDALEREQTEMRRKYGTITSVKERVNELVGSVDDFETRFLRVPQKGSVELYQRINGLMSAYNLTNTSGPNYVPLEIIERKDNSQNSEKSGKAKFQSLFPGDYVTVTVEGSYQNLRRFIREIESSSEFVISTVELEPAEGEKKKDTGTNSATINQVKTNENFPGTSTVDPNGIPTTVTNAPKPNAPRGKTHGETVSLRIEMATYYRRPGYVPPAPEADGVVSQ